LPVPPLDNINPLTCDDAYMVSALP
jgi:hypothetical protein